MLRHYRLQPQIPDEPDPVTLIVDEQTNTTATLELVLSIAGARHLRPRPAVDPDGARIMMRAGASFDRWEGVRLSNGFNVIDPDTWHRQGIGTIALNAMIEWAQHNHPSADVRPVELSRYGRTIGPADRRLAFYRRFNLDWDPNEQRDDEPHWLSRPMPVAALRLAPLPYNIEPLP